MKCKYGNFWLTQSNILVIGVEEYESLTQLCFGMITPKYVLP